MYLTIILNHDNKEFNRILKKYKINYKYDCRCIDDIIFYEYIFDKKNKLIVKLIMDLLHIEKVILVCACNSYVNLYNYDKHKRGIKHLTFINPL
jgi:hypothetical protein